MWRKDFSVFLSLIELLGPSVLTVEKSKHKFLFTTFLFKKTSVVVVGLSRQIGHTKAKVVYQPFRAIFIEVQTTFV